MAGLMNIRTPYWRVSCLTRAMIKDSWEQTPGDGLKASWKLIPSCIDRIGFSIAEPVKETVNRRQQGQWRWARMALHSFSDLYVYAEGGENQLGSLLVFGSPVSWPEKDRNQTGPRLQKTGPAVRPFYFWDVKTAKKPVNVNRSWPV